MGSFYKIVLCSLCVNIVFANAYKVGALQSADNVQDVVYSISEAGKRNLDLLVLPSDFGDNDSYDETIKTLSKAAKQANLYLVAHLKENIRCDNIREKVRSNIVFDNNGEIVADYRKPENKIANCTKLSTEPATFSTDFGSFVVMMEEDLVMRRIEELKGVRNVVVLGVWGSDVPFLRGVLSKCWWYGSDVVRHVSIPSGGNHEAWHIASNFATSWSYTNNLNLITSHGVYAGKSGLTTDGLTTDGLMVARVGRKSEASSPVLKTFPLEDLSQYIIKPLDLEAGLIGYSEKVCHNDFCCDFYIKIGEKDSKSEASYGLAVFDGQRHYGGNQYIGLQNCGVFACAGLYKRTCNVGSGNNTNLLFEKLVITANFTKQTAQYPIVLANRQPDSFKFGAKTDRNTEATVSLTATDSILTFGIIGRDFERDYEVSALQNTDGVIFDYIFSENVQEFFDYVWIRLRILIVVVSIYVLEMM